MTITYNRQNRIVEMRGWNTDIHLIGNRYYSKWQYLLLFFFC